MLSIIKNNLHLHKIFFLKKLLIIQTAFLGDVILSTSVIEKIHNNLPDSLMDLVIRKGAEDLFINHPYINKLFVWDKKNNKYKNFLLVLTAIRKEEYDYVINLHRFFSSGLLSILSKSKETIGFDKNPLSFLFSKRIKHKIFEKENPLHEIERNDKLLYFIDSKSVSKPKLYPQEEDEFFVKEITNQSKYYCIAPSSVWFTKQLPIDKWVEICNFYNNHYMYIIGTKNDYNYCEEIKKLSNNLKIINLAGKLSLLQTVVLLKNAIMNYTNDSAPLHLCSAIDAKITAFFCSTIPEFGFTPVSSDSHIAQIEYNLKCRPCGLHGKKKCPEKHFKCANDIKLKNYLLKN